MMMICFLGGTIRLPYAPPAETSSLRASGGGRKLCNVKTMLTVLLALIGVLLLIGGYWLLRFGKTETQTETQTEAKPEKIEKPLSPEEKLVGSYEAKKSAKHVLLENGKSETWILGVKRHGGTWKIDGKEVHVGIEKLTHVCKIKPNGDLILIAKISDGKRTDVAKENQFILEKSNN